MVVGVGVGGVGGVGVVVGADSEAMQLGKAMIKQINIERTTNLFI